MLTFYEQILLFIFYTVSAVGVIITIALKGFELLYNLRHDKDNAVYHTLILIGYISLALLGMSVAYRWIAYFGNNDGFLLISNITIALLLLYFTVRIVKNKKHSNYEVNLNIRRRRSFGIIGRRDS